MSDLKHRSPTELSALIFQSAKYRDGLEAQWKAKEAQIETLKVEIDELRKKHHNAGQREAWARVYLAQKT
ncbi:hypothetical protein [Aminobacter phage Erebus]|nr:hypothetical protein [Aminobacter phage Erebus]